VFVCAPYVWCSVAEVFRSRGVSCNSQNFSCNNNNMYVIFYEVISL
jgi:hypothetical protein